MEMDVLFCHFVRRWILQSPSPPSNHERSLSSSLVCPLISPQLPKKKGPVHLLLIYLGHACENRSIFCGSPWGRNRAKGCDCREIKPLKPMLCLVFRAAREPRSLDVLQKHPGSNYSRQRKCACEVEGGKITCLSHWSNIQVLSFAPQEGP